MTRGVPVAPRAHVHQRGALTAKQLGRAMTQARVESGLSVFEVARATNYNADVIKAWERGEFPPSVFALDAYARACGVSLREVLP